MQPLKDRTAITGVGWSAFTKASGTTPMGLAAQASLNAIDDAGLSVKDIDGIVTFRYGRAPRSEVYPEELMHAIGIEDLSYQVFSNLGGSEPCSVVTTAATAVLAGVCKNVLVFYSGNGRSERLSSLRDMPMGVAGARQLEYAYGAVNAATLFGRPVMAHMAKYGTTNLDMAHVAVSQRQHAMLNTKAMMRKPLTVEEHQASPWIVHPFRLFDTCLQSDGAVALVISSAEQARDLRQAPVYIMAASGSADTRSIPWETGCQKASSKLYAAAGITSQDVDLAELYDPFTGICLLHIEGFGLAPKGEGAAWVKDGNNGLDGSTPVNTHGGLLSEAHIHGLNAIAEAVQQLRPSGVVDDLCEGSHDYDRSRCRQVRNPRIGLVCGESGASALLLRSSQ